MWFSLLLVVVVLVLVLKKKKKAGESGSREYAYLRLISIHFVVLTSLFFFLLMGLRK